jgi:uncharacterized protein (TIGR03435 family)
MAEFIGNHLWQSTIFSAVAALLTLFFRKNHARIRFSLWLAASIKFLVPFSLLIAIGDSINFSWKQTTPVPPAAISYVENISQPFGVISPATAIPATIQPEQSRWLPVFLFVVWLCGAIAVSLFYLAKWRCLRTAIRDAKPIRNGRAFEALESLKLIGGYRIRIKLASTASSMEPGVVGIFRPILWLPEGMIERLDSSELEAVIAHELAHVRRHDNLISAIHMLIETLFWFHPMIWWLGAKLVQERERACDEAVLQLGKDPQAYAEGILKICEFCLESPLTCVSGVTGADMKQRIQAIMTHRIGGKLSLAGKLMLALAGFIGLAVPVAIGILNASPGQAQSQGEAKPSFDVVSVKPTGMCGESYSPAPGQQMRIMARPVFQPGRYHGCTSLKGFMEDAFQTEPSQMAGGPDWAGSGFYQIEAKADPAASTDQMRLMLQTLLEERFKLKTHHETRDLNAYLLLEAKGGNKLQQAKDENGNPITALPPPEEMAEKAKAAMRSGQPFKQGPGSFTVRMNANEGLSEFNAVAVSMKTFAASLMNLVGRKVIDKTGIAGFYDIKLRYAFDPQLSKATFVAPVSVPAGTASPAPASAPAGPSVFTALQDQLGLKLEPEKVPTDFIVIDSADKPSEN